MKTFKSELERFNKENFALWQIVVASEVNSYGLEISDDEFETICDFCYNIILDCSADPNVIVRVVVDLLEADKIKVADLVEPTEELTDRIADEVYLEYNKLF